jgi:hypothetical protein
MSMQYTSSYTVAYLEKFQKDMLQSLFNPQRDLFIDHCTVEPIDYGQKSYKRAYLLPDENIQSGARFDRQEKKAEAAFANLDLRCYYDSHAVERSDFAGNPNLFNKFGSDKAINFRQGLNAALWTASFTNPIVHGIMASGDGTLANPYWCASVTTNGTSSPWYTVANVRTKLITAEANLIANGFYPPYDLIAPPITAPMFTELISNTALPVSQWINSTNGINIIFDQNVDTDATVLAFDCYMVARNAVVPVMSQLVYDNFYNQDQHKFKTDYELYMTVAYNVQRKSGSTNIYKGVVLITQAAFNSA